MDSQNGPPAKKIKIAGSGTAAAASAFFKKTSEKPKSLMKWSVHETLIKGRYRMSDVKARDKVTIAAFDLDGTLIKTQSGSAYARSETDWKFYSSRVVSSIRGLHDQGVQLVIFSNQAGIKIAADAKRYAQFKTKLEAVCKNFDVPLLVYAATAHDEYRKPRTGMWTQLVEDLKDLYGKNPSINMQDSFFAGDAAGRPAVSGTTKDFSASDFKFALNLNLSFYTPDSAYSSEPQPLRLADIVLDGFNPRSFANPERSDQWFERTNPQDLVLFVGSPAAGKSTYYKTFLEPLGYIRVNQDTLGTRQKCQKVAEELLRDGRSVCVDNTNADVQTRKTWLALAETFPVPVRCVHFTTSVDLAQHNNMVRAYAPRSGEEKRDLLPKVAFTSYVQRYQKPTLEEGFQDVKEVSFILDDDRPEWRRFWL